MMLKDRVFKCCRCLKAFNSRANSNNLFCSRECAFAFPAEAGIRSAGWSRVREDRFTISWCACGELVLNGTACRGCLEPIVKEREEQRKRNAYWRERDRSYAKRTGRLRGTCKECGIIVAVAIGVYAKSRCDGCRAKHKRESRYRVEAVRSARKRAAFVEPVWRKEVFDRDGWRCQLCGKDTPRRLLGTCKSNAPTLDHIKPLAKGGRHSYDNTQCACFRCNAIKSDDAGGQLRLWGIVKPGGTRILDKGE